MYARYLLIKIYMNLIEFILIPHVYCQKCANKNKKCTSDTDN